MQKSNFDNSYAQLDSSLYTKMNPEKVKAPEVLLYNNELAEKLGLEGFYRADILSGNNIPSGAEPLAQAYAGHQFGYLNILGDGRAILLGECLDRENRRFDIQFKGSGRTPYSRGGDGKATLSSMLREYLISYAMEHLGIPTTSSLSVVKTGEDVYRENVQQGAVLTRIASSHIRVGTFQYVAVQGDYNLLKNFTNYAIKRHYPEVLLNTNPYLSLLEKVMDKQIELIVNWMRVGFIHGVMNTDNMAISGETIDYGPCAFMDIYDPGTVYSSIDKNARYSFSNQQKIGQWNIARFAETLIPLIDPNTDIALQLVNEVIESYTTKFKSNWINMMGKKIGIKSIDDSDSYLIYDLLDWMYKSKADYTKTFRLLLESNFITKIPNRNSALQKWYDSWILKNIDMDLIRQSNPLIIPRNHIVEDILSEASSKNNLEPINRFLEVLKNPYSDMSNKYYSEPPLEVNRDYKTYCGT